MKKKKSSGGARQGSGRKSAEELGIEKKATYQVYLYPSYKDKLVKKYGSLTKSLEMK